LRKLVSLTAVVFAFFLLASFASAQQFDVGFGAGTIMSPSTSSDSVTGLQTEKGGTYPNVGFDVIFHRRIGFGFETAWRASQGIYSEGILFSEPYRPILYDFNAVYQPRLGKKLGADLSAGIGGEDLRFYTPNYTCGFSGCTNYTSSTHFLEHFGGGIRYYFWHHFFVRPEVNYYHIQNNLEFSSDNVLRVGGTLGYTLAP
jgi:hypothetical protein